MARMMWAKVGGVIAALAGIATIGTFYLDATDDPEPPRGTSVTVVPAPAAPTSRAASPTSSSGFSSFDGTSVATAFPIVTRSDDCRTLVGGDEISGGGSRAGVEGGSGDGVLERVRCLDMDGYARFYVKHSYSTAAEYVAAARRSDNLTFYRTDPRTSPCFDVYGYGFSSGGQRYVAKRVVFRQAPFAVSVVVRADDSRASQVLDAAVYYSDRICG